MTAYAVPIVHNTVDKVLLSKPGETVEQTLPERLLQRPRPGPGESLTGYLARLAVENFTDVPTITRGLTKQKGMGLSYTWDLYGPEAIDFDGLSRLTGTSEVELQTLTFYPLWLKFGLQPLLSRATSAFISLSVVKTHPRFCPFCVRENGIMQLLWSIEEINVCPLHHVRLQDRCSSCGSSLPYLKNAFKCINGCTEVLSDNSEYVTDEGILREQDTRWMDWQMLLYSDGRLVNLIEGHDPQQSIMATALYVHSLNNGKSENRKLLSFEQRRYLQAGPSGNCNLNAVLPLKKLILACRESNIPLSHLPNIIVPSSFIDSLHEDPRSTFVCKAPWCISFGRRDHMIKVSKHAKIHRGIKYNYHSICTECGIEHGIDSSDGLWKTIGDDVYWVTRLRGMLISRATREKIRRTEEISQDRVCKYVGYLTYHRLLPQELLDKFTPANPITEGLVERFEQMAVDALTQRLPLSKWYRISSGWSLMEYFYYRANKDVTIYLYTKFKYPHKGRGRKREGSFEELGEQIEAVLQRLLCRSIPITYDSVSQELGISCDVIRNQGYGKIVRRWRDIQRQRDVEQMIILAYQFIKLKQGEGKRFRPVDFFIEHGVNPGTARHKYPQVFNLLTGEPEDDAYFNDLVRQQEDISWKEVASTRE